MKEFLNRYMAANRNLNRQSEEELTSIFTETCKTILDALGRDAFRPERAVNAALVDSLMVGTSMEILGTGRVDSSRLIEARSSLLKDEDFIDAISTGTSQKLKVELRLEKAIEAICHKLS